MGNCIQIEKKHIINGYQIKKRISTTRWSIVYEGQKQNQVVAIKKIMKLPTQDDKQWVENCQGQGRLAILANFQNKIAPEVYGSFWRQNKKNFYIVMEKCDGSLLQKITKPLQLNEKIDLSILVMQAILKLHQNKIIHLDLKPSNILLNKNNEVKITDFGFSFIYNNSKSFRQYEGGTHIYSSPQRLRNNKCDKNSDLWSLGIILIQIWSYSFLEIFTFKQSKMQILQKILKWKQQGEEQTLKQIKNQRIRIITKKLLEKQQNNRMFLFQQFQKLKQQQQKRHVDIL